MIRIYLGKLRSSRLLQSSGFDVYSGRELSDDASGERLSRYAFWEKRYKRNDHSTFDWFLDSRTLLHSITRHMEDLCNGMSHNQLRYLELGCGTSELPLSIFKNSYVPVFVFALDYIKEAVHQQSLRSREAEWKRKGSDFQGICGDVLNLPFKGESFDIAVDKGTMDALIKNRSQGHLNSSIMLNQVMKCLRKGGRFIQVSDEDPDTRMEFLDSLGGKNCDPSIDTNIVDITDEPLLQSNGLHTSCNVDSKRHLRENHSHNASDRKWTFQILNDEKWNKEYFMYWTEKG